MTQKLSSLKPVRLMQVTVKERIVSRLTLPLILSEPDLIWCTANTNPRARACVCECLCTYTYNSLLKLTSQANTMVIALINKVNYTTSKL